MRSADGHDDTMALESTVVVGRKVFRPLYVDGVNEWRAILFGRTVRAHSPQTLLPPKTSFFLSTRNGQHCRTKKDEMHLVYGYNNGME